MTFLVPLPMKVDGLVAASQSMQTETDEPKHDCAALLMMKVNGTVSVVHGGRSSLACGWVTPRPLNLLKCQHFTINQSRSPIRPQTAAHTQQPTCPERTCLSSLQGKHVEVVWQGDGSRAQRRDWDTLLKEALYIRKLVYHIWGWTPRL